MKEIIEDYINQERKCVVHIITRKVWKEVTTILNELKGNSRWNTGYTPSKEGRYLLLDIDKDKDWSERVDPEYTIIKEEQLTSVKNLTEKSFSTLINTVDNFQEYLDKIIDERKN